MGLGGKRLDGGIAICGTIAMGETLSTGGNAAQGDFAGVGAGAVFEESRDGFSAGLLV